ncbi:hypothetical protein [Nocardia cyriacigeorgica]|uniref:hypothetical protein n=1 Tax=Nocardia cyriacigeorgica TaxID=135487 RepID=UPI002454B035|nr:hypothetical protein [Nocardia cyriacigeorgica]
MTATWAKAPDFADQPARRAAVAAQTVVDKARYLEEGLTPLRCQTCQTEVLVRKSSAHQTSIQWTGDPAAHCPVYAKLAEQGAAPGRPESCADLERTAVPVEWDDIKAELSKLATALGPAKLMTPRTTAWRPKLIRTGNSLTK